MVATLGGSMLVMNALSQEFLAPMERYRQWVFAPATLATITQILSPQKDKLKTGEVKTSEGFLKDMDHARHDGLPGDFVGINLNSEILKKHIGQFDGDFIKEARRRSDELDEELQHILGAKVCALKMYYPPGGYIQWHTNWDSPGYNVIFTHSKDGNGYWRHVDSKGALTVVPAMQNLVHINDVPGWHCKAGYFGKKEEADQVVWHSAYTREHRLTLSYIVYDKSIWENLVEEIREG